MKSGRYIEQKASHRKGIEAQGMETRGGMKYATGSVIILHHSPGMDKLERKLREVRVLREGASNDSQFRVWRREGEV